MTRDPRVRDSATFSAGCRQREQRRNRASPSFQSPLFLSNDRGVLATVKFETAAPAAVNLSSGSAVRLPMTVTFVSAAMVVVSFRGAVRGKRRQVRGWWRVGQVPV